MKIFVFGNGNLSFHQFLQCYVEPLQAYFNDPQVHFLLCDFRGVDTLMMEYLKSVTASVSIYHIGTQPRYMPDKYKTKVSSWQLIGGFESDGERDRAAIDNCTHFLAIDQNSDAKRKSGTLRNIELCQSLNKQRLS
ncbi:MAG: hypothetical protein AAFO94_09930 [Bacteroidota bacterium]